MGHLSTYVRLQKVWFFSRFGDKEGINFDHFHLSKIGYGFRTLFLTGLCCFRRSYFFVISDKIVSERP